MPDMRHVNFLEAIGLDQLDNPAEFGVHVRWQVSEFVGDAVIKHTNDIDRPKKLVGEAFQLRAKMLKADYFSVQAD